MTDEYKDYFVILDSSIPNYIYGGLFLLFVLGVIFILADKSIKDGWRKVAVLALVEYLFLIICSTLIFRATKEIREYNFQPFWSYEQCFRERGLNVYPQIALNILVFLPIGFLIGLCLKGANWWKVMMLGVGISMSIEAMQLIFKRGLSELDDIFNNTLGCIVGYWLYFLVKMMKNDRML